VEVGEACGVVSWTRGGRAVAGANKLVRRKPSVRKSLCSRSLAGGSTQGRLLDVKGKTAVLFLGLDDDGEAGTAVATLSRTTRRRERQSGA
jgi:hypothetical protein